MKLNIDSVILIVDDFEKSRKDLISMLKNLGFKNFIEADSGQAALDQLSNTKQLPELIFIDWIMPNMSGIDLITNLKKDLRTKEIPLIMVTAESELDQIVSAINVGASNYIIKPINQEDLEKKILKL